MVEQYNIIPDDTLESSILFDEDAGFDDYFENTLCETDFIFSPFKFYDCWYCNAKYLGSDLLEERVSTRDLDEVTWFLTGEEIEDIESCWYKTYLCPVCHAQMDI